MALIRWCEGVWFIMANGDLGALHAVPMSSRTGQALCSEVPRGVRVKEVFDTEHPRACGHCVKLAVKR